MRGIEPQPLEERLRRLLKLRVWVAETLRLSDLQVTLVWAAAIGVMGALAAALFRVVLDGIPELLTGQPGGAAAAFPHLVWWQRLLLPTAGGALAGVVLHYGRRLGRSQKSSDYMEAIVVGDGRISIRTSLVQSVSSLCSGASGASIGREGPMVQLASMLASLVGRVRGFTLPMRRQIVACGAAAGVASAYHAPIASAFFVGEIVLGSVSMEYFGPMVVSSVVATLVTRAVSGAEALYRAPTFQLTSAWEILPHVLLGIGCGLLAPLYLRLLRTSDRGFARLPLHRIAKLALGGAVVGALAIAVPEVCGNGYNVAYSVLHGQWLWRGLAVVLVCKLLATAATFGSGAVGGVFTPTLVMGSALGYLFGAGVAAVFPYSGLEPSAYALVGMGAFLAASTGAPIMAIIMLFELTLDYQIILPLMLACVVGYYTARTHETKFIYGEALERKGAGAVAERLARLKVFDLMKADVARVLLNASFREIGEAFLANRFNNLYVVDEQNRFLGVVSLHDVKGYLDQPELARVLIARDVLHEDFPFVTPESGFEIALRSFERTQSERLPVVESDEQPRLLGSLSKTDLLLHLAGHGMRL